MSKAGLTCYGCGGKGHIESECPNAGIDATGKPPWCGFCDERTRHIDHGQSVSRCQECHPLRRQAVKQDRRCPSCHQLVYEWDTAPCGSHVGPAATDRRPEREHIDAVIASAT